MNAIQEVLFKLNSSSKKKVYPVDFHIHTNWTDGQNSIQEMHDSSILKGVKAILFSEHVRKKSSVWFKKFAKEIKKLSNDKCYAFVGAETKVLDFDGNLDCSETIYKYCDMLMGVVHRFPGEIGNIKENKITISKKEAIETEFELSRSLLKYSNIDILGHPFGMSYKRFKSNPDEKKIIELVELTKKKNKFFEINSVYHPNPWRLIRICKSIGTRFSIGSNAHSVDEVGNIIRKLKDKI